MLDSLQSLFHIQFLSINILTMKKVHSIQISLSKIILSYLLTICQARKKLDTGQSRQKACIFNAVSLLDEHKAKVIFF